MVRSKLPISPPLQPQLARPRAKLPDEEGWAYEPKLDGFRAIAFVTGTEHFLQSRNGKDLGRYFPEVTLPEGNYVVDGELVIEGDGSTQEFGLLQQRIHPAQSRIDLLASEIPATLFAFDLLALDGKSLIDRPFSERREQLEENFADSLKITPLVTEASQAEPWLANGEGVIAKQLDAPYRPGERTGMVKVKRLRTIDCVVVGWRPGKEAGTLGSLILGLYDDAGELRVVGHSSGFRAKQKRELPEFLAPYETGERGSGEPSRWSAGRDLEWIELRPELVAEVAFDHVSDGRIRHGAKFKRWRDDKDPGECRIEQLES